MNEAAKAIEAATKRLMEMMNNAPKRQEVSVAEMNVHQALLNSTMAITNAIGQLMKAATLSQQEIVAKGKGTASASQFYKKNNRWTDGLISAARMIVIATSNLVSTADGIIKGTHNLEQLVVATHEVAASTAQLVAASRVKADRGSHTQENLENASKAVTEATKLLVKASQEWSAKNAEDEKKKNLYDFTNASVSQMKKKDMEQQVKILTLEKELNLARRLLLEMRKQNYHDKDDGEDSSDDEVEPPKTLSPLSAVPPRAAQHGPSKLAPSSLSNKPIDSN